jgi:hypothetical protein
MFFSYSWIGWRFFLKENLLRAARKFSRLLPMHSCEISRAARVSLVPSGRQSTRRQVQDALQPVSAGKSKLSHANQKDGLAMRFHYADEGETMSITCPSE